MENDHNFMRLAATGFGLQQRVGSVLALTFCRRLLGTVGVSHALMPLRHLGVTFSDWQQALEGRGAVERVLRLPNRALNTNVSFGLLRGEALGFQSDGTVIARALTGSEPTGVRGAGASFTRRLASLLQAFYRASLIERGRLLPSQPCIDELPSHAPTFNTRNLSPDGMYACAYRTGFQKLF